MVRNHNSHIISITERSVECHAGHGLTSARTNCWYVFWVISAAVNVTCSVSGVCESTLLFTIWAQTPRSIRNSFIGKQLAETSSFSCTFFGPFSTLGQKKKKEKKRMTVLVNSLNYMYKSTHRKYVKTEQGNPVVINSKKGKRHQYSIDQITLLLQFVWQLYLFESWLEALCLFCSVLSVITSVLDHCKSTNQDAASWDICVSFILLGYSAHMFFVFMFVFASFLLLASLSYQVPPASTYLPPLMGLSLLFQFIFVLNTLKMLLYSS